MYIKHENVNSSEGWAEMVSCMTRDIKYRPHPAGQFAWLHYHDYFEILYGVSGQAFVCVGNKKFNLCAGDMVIINPKDLHEVQCESGCSANYYVIKFLPNILHTHSRTTSGVRYLLPVWQKEVEAAPLISASELNHTNIGNLIEDVMREWDAKKPGYELAMQADIMQIFVWMIRNRCPASALSGDVPDDLYKILQSVLEETEHHLTDWTVEDAAKFANLSYSYFSRNFKKAYGISYSSYLETLHLREAENLLLSTEREITDIASSLGFCTTSYFIDRFRRRYGTTPRLFRMKMKQSE